MGKSESIKVLQMPMDKTDISYVVELLNDGIHNEDWDAVVDAREFLKEYLDDDGGPIELEE
jgi:hypothetical protein